MSFAVRFLPAGSSPVLSEDDDETPLTDDELATWDRLEPRLTAAMPQPLHVVNTDYARQLVHEQSGLMVTWEHGNYQASVPYWSSNATSGGFDALARVVEVVESETGLVGIDETSETRFLDHTADAASMFASVAEGFEQAMERQTLFGWVRGLFRR